MAAPSAILIRRLEKLFEAARDDERAIGMARYMRDGFPFYGVMGPTQQAIAREVTAGLPAPTEAQLRAVTIECWTRAEREWQYFACGYLRRHVRAVSPRFLSTVRQLITTKPWWDTVDSLAIHTVGPLVRADSGSSRTMDRWIADRDVWLARTALLHQITYKAGTDADRLFAYCVRRAGDTEFFIRKAIGWALREYSKTDERAVRRFVHEHDAVLSGLSKREALKWLERGGRTPRARDSSRS